MGTSQVRPRSNPSLWIRCKSFRGISLAPCCLFSWFTGCGLAAQKVVDLASKSHTLRAMSILKEIEAKTHTLSEVERALLAAHLLDSLPPSSLTDDDGVDEALNRLESTADDEFLTHEQFVKIVHTRRQ